MFEGVSLINQYKKEVHHGESSKRRKAYQKKNLVALSYDAPQIFVEQWDMRLESWLIEVRKLAAKWRDEKATNKRAFEILERALALLSYCNPKIATSVHKRTYDELSNACSVAVAGSIDSRLYTLSNFNTLKYKSRKDRGTYGSA